MKIIMKYICQNSVEHTSVVERKATKTTDAIKYIQVTKAIVDTPISLATATYVVKWDT